MLLLRGLGCLHPHGVPVSDNFFLVSALSWLRSNALVDGRPEGEQRAIASSLARAMEAAAEGHKRRNRLSTPVPPWAVPGGPPPPTPGLVHTRAVSDADEDPPTVRYRRVEVGGQPVRWTPPPPASTPEVVPAALESDGNDPT